MAIDKALLVNLTTVHAPSQAHQAVPPHHKGPDRAVVHEMLSNPLHRTSLKAEAASPTLRPWAPIHHPSPLYREVASTQAATPAEIASVTSKEAYKKEIWNNKKLAQEQ